MFQNAAEVQAYIKESGIRFVDFKMIDLHGRWRHLCIPASRFDESLMESGIGFDGSNYGYAAVENSDMVFIPDVRTAVVDPFVEAPTLTMVGDVRVIDHPNNRPFDQYPRNVLRRAVEFMREEGIADEMIVGPEFEFHVFDGMAYDVKPDCTGYRLTSVESEWSAGSEDSNGYHVRAHEGYHADLPGDIHYDLRNEMCEELEHWNVPVKYHHHEVSGSGQMEIETELIEVCKAADDTMATKYVLRNCAARSGKTVTLMPKPIRGEAGNGMHVHMLLKKDGRPLFYDENGYAQLSRTAMYFIGGLLAHVRSLCALTNPSTNSYRRLVPGFEAPVTIGYASANRSAVIRIPAYVKSPDKKRFELRNPDATCNPYFAYAAILMAGLDGVRNKIDPANYNWGPFDFNLFALPEEEKARLTHLPASLEEALNALEADHDYLTVGSVFPERLLQTWVKTIRREARYVESYPSPAEFEMYYDL